METIVADRREVERGVVVRTSYALISVCEPESKRPRVRKPILLRGVLFLKFHDAEEQAQPDIILMTDSQARRVWKFVFRHIDEIGTLVVHCEQGTSRSPAIAAAVCKVLGGDESTFFQNYSPNRHVCDLMLKTAASFKRERKNVE